MDCYKIITLGCKVNQYESQAIEELLDNNGFVKSKDDELADVIVINTCTVTNMSARKSRQLIRRSKRNNPDAIVVVLGCYAQVSPEEIESIDDVDIIIGTDSRDRIVELIKSFKADRERKNIVSTLDIRPNFPSVNLYDESERTRAYIKVQDGCNRYCSYCIIPYARGNIRSRSINDTVEEARHLANNGFKELVLTGIHIGSYGKEIPQGPELIDLIEAVATVDGIERIRMSSIEPIAITEDFLQRALKTEKFCDHFHLSLQSGSDKVLRDMNRRYTTDEYRETVDLIRKFMPHAGITTDIIVGFPGETEKDFNETLRFVKSIGFSRLHVFTYSPREGTPAAKRSDQINGNIKKSRSHRLIDLGKEMELDFVKQNMNRRLEVLFEEPQGNKYYGYTKNYIRVMIESEKDLENQINYVKIKEEGYEPVSVYLLKEG